MTQTSLPPHPILGPYYRDPAEKREYLRNIFDDTARDYDRMEALASFGTGRWYRRQALRRAGLASGMAVLDVATGTGLLAREALSIVRPAAANSASGSVTGVDPSTAMLQLASDQLGIPTIVATAEAIPVESAKYDFVTMGYALRHVADLHAAFTEMARTLKPGGRICVLEISRPANALIRAMLKAHFKLVFPVAARFVGRSRRTSELWKYYWETIEQCVPPERVLRAMTDAGLADARRSVSLGFCSEYTATRP